MGEPAGAPVPAQLLPAGDPRSQFLMVTENLKPHRDGGGDWRGRYTALGMGPGTSCGTCWRSTCATLSHLQHQARRGGLGQSQWAGNPTESEQLWLMSLEQTLSRSGLQPPAPEVLIVEHLSTLSPSSSPQTGSQAGPQLRGTGLH